VKGTDEVLVDIAIDVAVHYPSQFSILGPTFSHEELAGRKLLALFDRAEARDFADVFVLAQMMRSVARL
jgi:predicted nucleotidyltransferase component of viral defense system